MRIYSLLASAAAAFSLASPAAATTVQVRLGGDTINVPAPEGYCEAKDTYLDIVQLAAAADSQNITLLGLFDCKEMAAGTTAHFIYVKAVKSALSTRVSLKELLDGLGAVPPSDIKSQLSDLSQTEKDLNQVSGKESKVTLNTVAPVASDANAYYMAGVLALSIGDAKADGAVAIALTSVKGHVLGYDFYGPGDTPSAVRAVLTQAKSEVPHLLAANP